MPAGEHAVPPGEGLLHPLANTDVFSCKIAFEHLVSREMCIDFVLTVVVRGISALIEREPEGMSCMRAGADILWGTLDIGQLASTHGMLCASV